MNDPWRGEDGVLVACEDKCRLLDRTETAIVSHLRDAFEDAVLMGVGPALYKARLHAIVDGLKDPRRR